MATLSSGDILVHSNESCAGGPGGYEIYNVDDPSNPVYLASVRIDDPNPLTPLIFGPITDVGVHNLWLFSQGAQDYVGVTTETAYGNFHIYDITDPANPVLVSFWGAEEIFDPGVVASADFGRNLDAALWLLDGFGASANRFLHDVTITTDGTRAYLANWDAGLVLLDISDPTNPQLVSVALDPANGSLDGEVNSHSVWPSADGTIVVEGRGLQRLGGHGRPRQCNVRRRQPHSGGDGGNLYGRCIRSKPDWKRRFHNGIQCGSHQRAIDRLGFRGQ